jgi:hypothetical protein
MTTEFWQRSVLAGRWAGLSVLRAFAPFNVGDLTGRAAIQIASVGRKQVDLKGAYPEADRGEGLFTPHYWSRIRSKADH